MNNIILCGFMGCGKSSVGRSLAKKLGMKFVDTDNFIVKQQKMAIREIFDRYGEAHFRDLEHEACKTLSNMQNCVIATGGGALTYERNVKQFQKDTIIFIDCPFRVIQARIGRDPRRPLMQRNDVEELFKQRHGIYQKAAHLTVDGAGVVSVVRERIIEAWEKSKCKSSSSAWA